MLRGVSAADLDALLARPPRPLAELPPEARRALLETAARHGALAAIAGRLPPDDADLRARFARLAAALRVRDAEVRAALDLAVGALAARKIEPCALKGPVLADRVHPEPALRPAGDVDLLVPEARLDDAVAALVEEGWLPIGGLQGWYERIHAHHVTLVHARRPPVELHFHAQSAFGAALRAEELLARSRPHVTASGARVRVLAPEDELLFLALHGAHHVLERGAWILDLLLLVEASPALDWPAVADRARAARCRRAVGWVLLHLARLGASIPAPLLEPVGAARARLADALRAALLRREKRDRAARALRVVFEAAMCDDVRLSVGRVGHEVHWFARRLVHRAAQRPRRSK
jgi:hypothetical protein